MIKSSDPCLSNTYRIIRVLSTHDYLATDHLRAHFIFSHLQTPEPSSAPLAAPRHQFLLSPKEVIEIDNMQYAVFPVGAKQVVWAPLLPSKKMEGQKFVWKLFRQACEGILKELLWMGGMQARKYINLKNFWAVGEELKVLLLPRQAPPKLTIKKSEARSTSGDRSLDHLMQAERSLMKEFALTIWQILFQCSYYDDHSVIAHARSRHLLRQMVSKSISFEELCLQLSKQSVETIYYKKARFKSLQKDLLPRRKTVSYIDHSKSSTKTLSNFRLYANTETVKRPYNTIKRQQSVIKQSEIVEIEPKTQQMRSSSVDNTSSNNGIAFRKSRYYPKTIQNSSKEAINFQRWLQSRRFSVQTRQKLIRNGEMARKKYSQAVELRREVGREEKFDDTGFKERILWKVIKFKNAIQQKKTDTSHIQSTINHEETLNNVDVAAIQTEQIPQIQSCLKSVQDKTSRDEPIIPKVIAEKHPQLKELMKVDKDQIQTQKQGPRQAQTTSIKTQKKRLNRVDAFNTTQIEDIQEIKLPEPKLVMPTKKQPSRQEDIKEKAPRQQTKQQATKQQSPLPPSLPQKTNKHSQKMVNPRDAVGQMLLLVNTLGDMTVRAVKLKDKLNDLNWRQIAYFVYERFHHERWRMAECLSRGEIVCRAHRRVDGKQWQQYLQREREEAVSQMRKQNEQITATLQRLGQKLLEEQTLQPKIQYFVRNRQKIKKDSKLRGRLSRFLVSSLVSEFDFVWEERVQREQVLSFMADCSFGMFVIGELDSILPVDKFVRLQDYKQYDKALTELKPFFDCIHAAYFPKGSQWEVL